MDIVELLMDDGSPARYLAKGRHPARVFAAALQAEYGYQVDELQRIEQLWIEVVPLPSDPAVCLYIWRDKGDARAELFTVVEF